MYFHRMKVARNAAGMKECRHDHYEIRISSRWNVDGHFVLSPGPPRANHAPGNVKRNWPHDIYKEFIEIQSGYTTGATTSGGSRCGQVFEGGGISGLGYFCRRRE